MFFVWSLKMVLMGDLKIVLKMEIADHIQFAICINKLNIIPQKRTPAIQQ